MSNKNFTKISPVVSTGSC